MNSILVFIINILKLRITKTIYNGFTMSPTEGSSAASLALYKLLLNKNNNYCFYFFLLLFSLLLLLVSLLLSFSLFLTIILQKVSKKNLNTNLRIISCKKNERSGTD